MRAEEPRQGLAVDGGEPGQLDGIDPALAALHLRDERLPRADLPADLGLGEAGVLPCLPQAPQEARGAPAGPGLGGGGRPAVPAASAPGGAGRRANGSTSRQAPPGAKVPAEVLGRAVESLEDLDQDGKGRALVSVLVAA